MFLLQVVKKLQVFRDAGLFMLFLRYCQLKFTMTITRPVPKDYEIKESQEQIRENCHLIVKDFSRSSVLRLDDSE